VPHSAIVSPDVAQTLAELSKETSRQIGLTIDRRGRVRHVIVGDAHGLFIPELGRSRAGDGRFRGIRLVHTHLNNEPLTQDDLTDLWRLRLDLVAAIGVSRSGRPEALYHTHLLPPGSEEPCAEQTVTTVDDESLDFGEFIVDLEEEYSRRTLGALETSGQTRAVAVHVSVGRRPSIDPRTSLRELNELASTADVLIVDSIIQRRQKFDPRFVMGRGKIEELLLLTMQLDCDLIIFDQDLSPSQARAIAEVTDVKVIDRSQLILDIFARRAHTREGKLAVELAQHRYRLPHLAGNSASLSKLMGGIGGRGPGESKLETDRRRARDRITALQRQLDETAKQRSNRRSRRQNREVPVVALVGYTNAGKSTLFNAITDSDVLTEDKLFATLHTTSRRLQFPQERELVVIDTVGFIRDLPKDLIVAFKATLEELREADLMLHVVDVADPRMAQQVESVEQILTEMELNETPRIKVFNKIDLMDAALAQNICTNHGAYGVQANKTSTTGDLLDAMETKLWQAKPEVKPPEPWEIAIAEAEAQVLREAEAEAQLEAELDAEIALEAAAEAKIEAQLEAEIEAELAAERAQAGSST
jgi:GTPase